MKRQGPGARGQGSGAGGQGPGAGGRGPGPRSRKAIAGITLLELLVVMALAAMIMAISFPSVAAGLDGVRLQASGRKLGAFLNWARARAERDQQPVEILIEPGRNQMSATSVDGKWERTMELAEGVRITGIAPVLEGDDVEAKPRRFVVIPGFPGPRLRIQLSTARGRSATIEVDPLTGVPQIQEGR